MMSCKLYLFRSTRSVPSRFSLKREFHLSSKKAKKKGKLKENISSSDLNTELWNYPAISSNQTKSIHVERLSSRIRQRRDEASRTLLIAPSINCVNPCTNFMRDKIESLVGRVNNVCLTSKVDAKKSVNGIANDAEKALRQSLLVEFKSIEQMQQLISSNAAPFKNEQVTYNSRLLHFSQKWSESSEKEKEISLSSLLNSCQNVSEQMVTLTNETSMVDNDFRARFFLCDLVESLFKEIFPTANIIPFGSTLSNLGRFDSDMDMILRLPSIEQKNTMFHFFSTKFEGFSNGRSNSEKQLKLMADVLTTALPGVIGMTKILKAKVPIISFKHSQTNLCCDLSVQTWDALIASHLFYTYTQLDERVKPFLFTLRRWSIASGLSSTLTNFPLTCLGLFYLIRVEVLPPVVKVVNLNQGVINNLKSNIHWKRTNKEALEDLLVGFFEFYSSFDFEVNAIDIFRGSKLERRTSDDIEIINPLNLDQNCAGLIVASRTLPRIISAVQKAPDILHHKKERDWGLLNLFQSGHDSDLADDSIDDVVIGRGEINTLFQSAISKTHAENKKMKEESSFIYDFEAVEVKSN